MTQQPNPMVPQMDWGKVAQGFGEVQGRQALLCASCVLQLGVTTPPQYVVVLGGVSYCLDHLPRPDHPTAWEPPTDPESDPVKRKRT